MYEQTVLDKLNRKFGRFAIRNLMLILVCGMATIFLLDLYLVSVKGISLLPYLIFDRAAILRGEVWRIFSFVLLPPESSLFWILFSLYFYWLIGSALEKEWGAFRFTLFYLCGFLGTVLGGLLTGYAGNTYLNLSLFLAFAAVFPDYQVLLFFLLPVKVKFLACIDAVYLLFILITGAWQVKIALLISLANVLLFFGRDFIAKLKQIYRRWKYRQDAGWK